jgi:hypothetical protein
LTRTAEQRPDDHLPLHPLEFRILLALLDGPSHGYRIVQEIEEAEGRERIWPANLYRRMRNLLAKGLIEETLAPQGKTTRRGGRTCGSPISAAEWRGRRRDGWQGWWPTPAPGGCSRRRRR